MSIAVGGYSSDVMYYAGGQSGHADKVFGAEEQMPQVESGMTEVANDGTVCTWETPEGQVNPLEVDPSKASYVEFMALMAYLVENGRLDRSDIPLFDRPTEDDLEKADYLGALREWRDMQIDVGNMAGHYKAAKVCNALINFRDEQTGAVTTIDTADGPVRAYKYEASVKSYLLGFHVLFDADGTGRSVQASYASDSTAENPVVEVRITDENGNGARVYRVNINDIDPSNATQLEMFALCSHLEKQGLSGTAHFGECYQNLLLFASNAGLDADTETFLNEKKNWIVLLIDGRAKELAEQYPAYAGWQELFLELLEQYSEEQQERIAEQEGGDETVSRIIEKVDGSKVLEIMREIGDTEVRMYLEVEKADPGAKMKECLKAYGKL